MKGITQSNRHWCGLLSASLAAVAMASGCSMEPAETGEPEDLIDPPAIAAEEAGEVVGIVSKTELEERWATAALSEGEPAAKNGDKSSFIVLSTPKYTAVLRQDSNHQVAYNQDWTTFANTWSSLSGSGYRLIDIDTSVQASGRRYTGVFEPGSGGYALWVGASWSSFTAKWDELSDQGLRLVDFETYMEGSERVYTGVWRAGSDGHYLWVGVDWASFVNKWNELAGYGLRLIDIEVWEENGSLRYGGVWRAGTGGYALWVGATWNGFADKWMELSASGQRLVDLEAYTFDGRRLYAGVFRAGSGSYDLLGAMSLSSLQEKIADLAAEGKQPIAIEYEFGEDMPPPGLASKFYDVIEGNAVGYSFAIAENGEIITAGGFGHARGTWESTDPGVAMTGSKRSHIASISKPITAVALMNLLESNMNVNLDTPFTDIIGDKFANIGAGVQNVTLRNLLQHRSGMQEWGSCGPTFSTSMAQLVAMPLVGTPGVTSKYSNGNFCLLRMVIEDLSGTNYVTYVRNTILAPMGISAMTCAPDASKPTLYYKHNVVNQAGAFWSDDYSDECSAYGWYASAADLARFLIGVRQNTVLGATTTNTMLSNSLGWFGTNTVDGTARGHNGAWYTGDRRGYNGSILRLPNGMDAVLLINTNGILDDSTNLFNTTGTLASGYNLMQTY